MGTKTTETIKLPPCDVDRWFYTVTIQKAPHRGEGWGGWGEGAEREGQVQEHFDPDGAVTMVIPPCSGDWAAR